MNFSFKNKFSAGILGAVVGATLALGGCSSTSNSDDGGDASSDLAGDTGPILYGLTTGDSCFDIVSVATTAATDGCHLGVADTVQNLGLVGAALPVNYNMTTATLTVGTAGSLGAGTISFNTGTLTREGNTSDSQMPTCTWHQTDNAQVTLTANNEFNISVTEVQNMFAAACSPATPGGTCTSTWTWHMVKGTKTPPACN